MINKRGLYTLAVIGLALSASANAALIDRGNGMIYDDVLDITWLQDANYARTSGYDADGRMTWDEAITWADTLVFGGYDDWRLPSVTDTGAPGCDWSNAGTDCGNNVDTASSELAYMYHINLGLESYYNEDFSVDPTWGLYGNGTYGGEPTDIGLIKNLQPYGYWSSTEVSTDTIDAWFFYTGNGSQSVFYKSSNWYAWAVRSGDVINVPTPVTVFMLGIGLLGMLISSRRC